MISNGQIRKLNDKMLNKLGAEVFAEKFRRKYKVGQPMSNKEFRELRDKYYMNGYDGLEMFEIVQKHRELTKAQSKVMKQLIKSQEEWVESLNHMNDI